MDIHENGDIFWSEFMKKENALKHLLYERTHESYDKATKIINDIAKNLGFIVNIIFGIDIRNSVILTERINHIEIIISPMMQRTNINYVNVLYAAYKKCFSQDFSSWSVIKYLPWKSNAIQNITVTYCDDEKTIEVVSNDFEYHPIVDHNTGKISIILFVNDDIAKYIIKKEKYDINGTSRELWIPKDCGIYTVLNATVGEFHLLNTIDKMEICLKSEEKEITRHKIDKLTDVVTMVASNPMTDIYNCFRCGYSNKQTTLKQCKCKKAWYCDTICQKAHRSLHKLNCINSV